MLHVIVDGANVVGSRPDGWWRDRAGAARRLAGQLVAALVADPTALVTALHREPGSGLAVHLVLEGAAARVVDLPTHPRLSVVHAPADGDASIAAVAHELAGADVIVVTADRALRERVRATGAATVGPGALLAALPASRYDMVGESPPSDDSVTLLAVDDERYFSTDADWDAER